MTVAKPVSIQVSYQPDIGPGDDFWIYIRPRQISLVSTQLSSGALSISWRLGGDYLTYDQPIRPYAHEAPRGEWTALGIPWPNVSGLLTFELILRLPEHGACLVACGEMMSSSYRLLEKHDLWVFAWSTAAETTVQPAGDRDLPGDLVSTRSLLRLDDGTDLRLLSVEVDAVAPPEAFLFQRFPYDHGAGRLNCDIPHGPEGRSHFLLPVSRGWGQPVRATLVGVGGYRQTTIELEAQRPNP